MADRAHARARASWIFRGDNALWDMGYRDLKI